MVRVDTRVRSLLYLVLFLTESAFGQADQAAEDRGNDEGPVVTDDLEEVEDALRTLNEAGVPPTREDLARFLKEDKEGKPGRKGGKGSHGFFGDLKYRVGLYRDEGWDHYGKISLGVPWLRLRARIREYRSGLRESTGTVELGAGPLELRAGVLGLSQGHGLLVGPPGRGSTLAADSGMGPRRERMVTWLGSDDRRALSGFGGTVRLGPWSLRFIREEVGGQEVAPPLRNYVIQVGLLKEDWRVSVAGQSHGSAGGASISAGVAKGPLSGSMEAMALVSSPGIPPAGAGIIQVRWSPVRGSGLEGQFGFSDLPAAPRLSSRPPVLPGWAGRGFAVRGFTRTSSGLVLRALFHLGQHLDRKGTRNRNTKMLVDLQASRKLLRPVQVSLRFRRDTRGTWGWSERYPWQAPLQTETAHRTIISAQILYEQNGRRARLMLRSYGLEKGATTGRRSLLGLSGRQTVGRGWVVRATWVSAWGDPVDLVSAVSPVSGMVLPRHWGLWRSETVLGLERIRGGLRIQSAISLRYPEKGLTGGPVPTFWAQAGISW